MLFTIIFSGLIGRKKKVLYLLTKGSLGLICKKWREREKNPNALNELYSKKRCVDIIEVPSHSLIVVSLLAMVTTCGSELPKKGMQKLLYLSGKMADRVWLSVGVPPPPVHM